MSLPKYADQVLTRIFDLASNAIRVDVVAGGGGGSGTNTNGFIDNQVVTTSPATFSVPANAVGFILESDSTNTDNIRWAIGSVASSSIGVLAEPGRDTGYIPCSADISVCALGGSQSVSVQWVLSS